MGAISDGRGLGLRVRVDCDQLPREAPLDSIYRAEERLAIGAQLVGAGCGRAFGFGKSHSPAAVSERRLAKARPFVAGPGSVRGSATRILPARAKRLEVNHAFAIRVQFPDSPDLVTVFRNDTRPIPAQRKRRRGLDAQHLDVFQVFWVDGFRSESLRLQSVILGAFPVA